MSLLFHDSELTELMKDFYVLTGIRIILFDDSCNELASYPPFGETLCSKLRENPEFDKKCRKCDSASFERCRRAHTFDVYKCHAGLIDATAPITEGGRIIGYMMFGQITDNKDKNAFCKEMEALCRRYGITDDLSERIQKIRFRSDRQIRAAAKILEALTVYIQLREIVSPSGKQLIDSIEHFIEEHISEEIDIPRLCDEFGISRTRLYEQTRNFVSGGLAAFIRHKRLEHAKKLLRTTDMTIPEISDAAGFSDYNYFLRVFRSEYGMSPRKMSKLLR